MKHLYCLITLLALVSCAKQNSPQTVASDQEAYANVEDLKSDDTLSVIFEGDEFEIGVPCGYINQKGDTIMPIGAYSVCFSETITSYGVVMEKGGKPIGIDRAGNKLYEIYWFDNGPDYVEDGLFRIRRNGKIGYADTSGKVVIDTQFACASPFYEGKAKVAFKCEEVSHPNDEHKEVKSDEWFFIDKMGEKVGE